MTRGTPLGEVDLGSLENPETVGGFRNGVTLVFEQLHRIDLELKGVLPDNPFAF